MRVEPTQSLPSATALGLLRRSVLWAQADDAVCRGLLSSGELLSGAEGELLLEQGASATHLYLLIEGLVRVFYVSPSSQRVTAKLFPAPNAFGDPEAVHTGVWQEAVEALSPFTALRFPRAHYLRHLQRAPTALFAQYQHVCRQFAVAIAADIDTKFATPRARLVSLLLAYAQAFGREHRRGVVIDQVLSQDALASQLGSNRRTVVRLFEALYEEGAIERAGRRLVLRDPDRLRASLPAPMAELCLPLGATGSPAPGR